MYNTHKLGNGDAVLMTPHGESRLSALSVQDIKDNLATHGVILLRGFDLELDDYSYLTQSLCKRVTLDPARKFVSKNAQLVDSGYDAIPLHCENGLTPFVPDVLLFMCETPASHGSATTYCDGERVWNQLSSAAKEYFSMHHFHFTRVLPKDLWLRYVCNEFGISDPNQVTPEFINKILTSIPKHHFELRDNGELFVDLDLDLVHKTHFSDRPAFANSLIGPSVNYQRPIVKDEEGHDIENRFVDEFQHISDEVTEDVLWQKHDVLIIDNSRYMHGRRKIEDTHRKIYAAMGYL